jgi:phosphoribosylamine--glycine ligase
MNILLVGSGGREHAIAWKLAQSKRLSKLYIAPGNPGTAAIGTNLAINPLDFEALKKAAIDHHIDMIVVGPEEPLVRGLHDSFLEDRRVSHIPVIGPKRDGARLEGSKDFAKAFMLRHGIPTARYKTFSEGQVDDAKRFLLTLQPPYVLKADGLAAGKGVVISSDVAEAYATLDDFFGGKFGDASRRVVIEEFLSGIELSVFVLTDGKSYIILPEAKDYKRIGEGDTGPNTGGMGAVSPVPFANRDFMDRVDEGVVRPTVNGLIAEGIDYRGFIFIGLMNVGGDPYVIEYNVRMGDPETEVVMPRIESDLVEMLDLTAKGKLGGYKLEVTDKTATTVIAVSKGYPGDYDKGKPITSIGRFEDSIAFHAGTKLVNGQLQTSGGRVLALTGLGNSMEQALNNSYRLVSSVDFEGMYFRRDIGRDLLSIK